MTDLTFDAPTDVETEIELPVVEQPHTGRIVIGVTSR